MNQSILIGSSTSGVSSIGPRGATSTSSSSTTSSVSFASESAACSSAGAAAVASACSLANDEAGCSSLSFSCPFACAATPSSIAVSSLRLLTASSATEGCSSSLIEIDTRKRRSHQPLTENPTHRTIQDSQNPGQHG